MTPTQLQQLCGLVVGAIALGFAVEGYESAAAFLAFVSLGMAATA